MSLPDSSNSNETNIVNDNHDDSISLPPPIPLNFKNLKSEKKHGHIPIIDSDVLFQSNSLFNNNSELKSTPSLNSTASTQIPLASLLADNSLYSNTGSIEQFQSSQLAAKQPEFPPTINVISYFNDLFRREIKGPHFKSKDDLFNFVEPYSIENYATKNFRKPGFLFFNTQTIEELTTFSDKPLSKPLLEKIPVLKKVIVEKLSINILGYIGAISNEKQDEIFKRRGEDKKEGLTFSIICILHDDESLVDECIMQLIKSMRKSPSQEMLILSWKLFLIIITMFYVKDDDIANVIRWFLVHRIFEKGIEGKYARFTFIRFYERIVLGRNFDLSMQRNEILRIPQGVQFGKRLFKCSLYLQMWNQKEKWPKLPIPLAVYLVVKALIKNGVMVTPKPFPDFGEKKQSSFNTKSSNVINDNDDNDRAENNEDEEIKEQKNDELNDEKNNKNLKMKNENISRKASLKIVKNWATKLSTNYDLVNDGEVCDLLGFLFTWMLNLLDPIIPKSMADRFIESFDERSDQLSKEKFVNDLPLLHKNTLKYLIGFLREIAQNEKFTLENHQTIAENLGSYFVKTSFATVDPFTRQKMVLASPSFLLFCLDNLDVRDVYPLNPAYEIQNEDQKNE